MKIKELKDIIKDLPDNGEVILFNDCSEWYGIELIPSDAIKVINNNLVIKFGLEWNEEDLEKYMVEEINKGGE